MTDAAAVRVFKRRGTIPPGHAAAIAAYLGRDDREGAGDA
jgi:hypothetical protein